MSHPNHFGTHAVWKDPKGEKSKTAPKKKGVHCMSKIQILVSL